MLQQEGILSVLKIFFSSENELKFCDIMLLLLKIDKACCINKYSHSFVNIFVLCM